MFHYDRIMLLRSCLEALSEQIGLVGRILLFLQYSLRILKQEFIWD
jgi:hypothetical protein